MPIAPIVAAVFVCESVIEHKNGILSIISMLDVAEVQIPPNVPPGKRTIQFKVSVLLNTLSIRRSKERPTTIHKTQWRHQ
jgi:hypothetical protein